MEKVWFTIDKYNHGCSGQPYKNKLEAIKGDSWCVWTEGRVRKQFNFGQGTMDDYKQYCKNNNCVTVSENAFWKIAEPLGGSWRDDAEKFIKETINRCKW